VFLPTRAIQAYFNFSCSFSSLITGKDRKRIGYGQFFKVVISLKVLLVVICLKALLALCALLVVIYLKVLLASRY